MTAHPRRILTLILLVPLLVLWCGCEPTIAIRQIVVQADGREIATSTEVLTVREALAEVGVTIDDDDRVEPDLWVELTQGMTIRVIRVQEEIIVEREVLPYGQQRLRSEALAAGEQRLVQAGKNGEVEITYRLQFEDGVEVSRSIMRRVVIEEPAAQITVVGVEGMLDSVAFDGTIAYLNAGNAWLMRGASASRQPVTGGGDLDGRAFALSPSGAYLLYSAITETIEFDGPFNDLYLLNVALVGEEPLRLPIQSVLWADWSPDGRTIAYTTGVKSGTSGAKGSGDLWVVPLLDEEGVFDPEQPRRILNGDDAGEYRSWGARYAWSPDGAKIAYARADQVGWVDVATRRAFPLASFAPYDTRGDEAWVSAVTWSPDSWYIAATIHAEEPARDAQESERFEVWAFDMGRQVRARLTPGPVGMWSEPRWSPPRENGSLVAYAEADVPLASYDSRYSIWVMDRDGSNARLLYPAPGVRGLSRPVTHAWSPDGNQVVVLYLGDLHIVDLVDGQVQQLTGDGQCTHVDWVD
ncbi:MAG: G5 domain-containing protein [Anaerolineae bacterium]|nr:G5 domain-containing protein [Anaerolineae bacterium]